MRCQCSNLGPLWLLSLGLSCLSSDSSADLPLMLISLYLTLISGLNAVFTSLSLCPSPYLLPPILYPLPR